MREKRRSMALSGWPTMALIVALAGCITLVESGERWSRQLTEFTGGPAAGNDWIPLSRPGSERQAGARVLNYFTAPQQSFLGGPDNSAQPQQHHFTFLNHQFPQSNRFVLQQPQPQELLEQPQSPAFHLSSFQRTPPFVGQTIQHPPPPPPPPPPASSTNPFEQQFLQSKSPFSEDLQQQEDLKQQQQQSFSYQHIRQQPELEQAPAGLPPPNNGAVSQEEVQLLYVPVETLYNNQKQPGQGGNPESSNRFNSLPQPVSPSLINDFYTSAATTTTPRPLRTSAATLAPQQSSRFSASSSSESSSRSSAGVSKPKPNQPPLALFLYNDGRQGKLSTSEALGGLKNINEIAVLDAVGKNSPKVFIGPSGLAPPKSYSRFDLPYLSSVDPSSNRANRKIEDLPFFVAPLSYKTPSGYSKISLPSPHVGSIVVRQSGGAGGNSLEQSTFYTRPTAASNVQYYTPSTLNFGSESATTKPPKSYSDADHYTSPTGKPTTAATGERGSQQYGTYGSGPPPSRHAVNEEYFNLAKTRKPTTTATTYAPTTPSFPVRSFTGSTRQFDFRPMPDQKIPPSFYPLADETDEPADPTTTTTTLGTTTTERPTTEAERVRSHFREENFRGRRPYQPPTQSTVHEDDRQGHFVHKFKLVDSVKPTASPTSRPSSTSTVVDNAFLDFFSQAPQLRGQYEDEMIKTTITTSLPGGGDRQAIRNNYYSAAAALNEDTGSSNRPTFVSTYYGPSSTAAGTSAPTTTPSSPTTQDLFFREFEQKSKFYQREPKFPESSFGSSTLGTTSASYYNKYKYETDGAFNDGAPPRYSVEVITTSEPTTLGTFETTQSQTSQSQYSIPSELPPISANLPGLVNALMDDQWPLKTGAGGGDRQTPAVTRPPPPFRKQLQRTTTTTETPLDESELATTTPRRPLQRGRRPHPSRTTPAPSYEQPERSSVTRAPISRSRSRYVPNNEERPVQRGRSRSRSTTPRAPLKEVENLDYQRDVLKQNYPVIRPQGGSSNAPVPTTTTAPAPTTTPTPATQSFREVYEDQTERLLATTLADEPSPPQVTRKYFNEVSYEPEAVVTTALPPQTTNYFPAQEELERRPQEEFLRPQEVLPLARDPFEQSVIPLRGGVATEPAPQQPVTESEEKLTTAYGQPLDEPMEIRKVEITPRPRRPGLVSRQRDSQRESYLTRTTTERTTTLRTTTAEPAVGSRTSGRRPAFVRRPVSRLYATTTVAPAASSDESNDQQQPTQGAYTVRPKTRQDILRGRTRRPTTTTEPTAAATTASPEAPVTRAYGRGNSLRRIPPTSRSRQEQTTATTTQQPAAPSSSGPRFRIRERTRFNLQPQESQWSTKLNQNSFQPVLKANVEQEEQENVSTEPEPEIVTAAREAEMFFMNVSSNYGQRGSKQEAPAEDSTENSVPSFADLLNDVMKDFIDENSTQKQATVTEGARERKRANEEGRRPVNTFRNNFLRKRGRSKVVDSFEAAESQHINHHAAQVYSYGESVKSIDQAELSGKDAPAKELYHELQSEEQENTAREESTVAPAPAEEGPRSDAHADETEAEDMVTVLPEVQSSSPAGDEPKTTSPPTEDPEPTLPSLEQTSTTNAPPQHQEVTTETAITDEPAAEDDTTDAPEQSQPAAVEPSSFDAVKKMVSDYYKVVENDSETEEMVDGEEPVTEADEAADEEGEDLHATDEPISENDELPSTFTTDMTPSETLFVPVTADPPAAAVNPMGSLVIPTSVSNGITHETEICYRGRCIKTEDDKRKRKVKLN